MGRAERLLREFDAAKVTVDNASPLGPEFTRAVYRHPLKRGGEFIAVHTAQEGVYETYGLMIGPNTVHINPPAEFFDRLGLVLCGLVTEETQDTLV